MIDSLAQKLAVTIKGANPDHPASLNVLKFSLGIVLNFVFIVLLSLTGAAILGVIKETVIVMVSFALLRQLSGGVHLRSGMACIIVSTIGILLISYLANHLDSKAILTLNGVNVMLAGVFAPSRIEKQTRINKRYFPILKILSTLIVASNFLFNSPILAATFCVQCLTLIKFRWERRG